MIQVTDFSEQTQSLYKQCKSGERTPSDLFDVLIENDFDKNEIIEFAKSQFKSSFDYLKKYINYTINTL